MVIQKGTTESLGPYAVLITAITSAAWAVTIVIFITVTVTLVRGKARIKRELVKARNAGKIKGVATFDEMDMDQVCPTVIDTSENVAYGHHTSKP